MITQHIPEMLRTEIVERIFPTREEFEVFLEKYLAARKPRGRKGEVRYIPIPEHIAIYKRYSSNELGVREAALAMGLNAATVGTVYKRFMVIAQGVADGSITL